MVVICVNVWDLQLCLLPQTKWLHCEQYLCHLCALWDGCVIFCTLQMKSFTKASINRIQKCVCCVVSSYWPSSHLQWVVKPCRVSTPPPDGSVLKAKINDPNHSLGCSTEFSSHQVEEGGQKYSNDASQPIKSPSGLREPMRAGAPVSMRACRRACGLYINRWICTDYTDKSHLLRRRTLHTPAPGKRIWLIFYFHELPFIQRYVFVQMSLIKWIMSDVGW